MCIACCKLSFKDRLHSTKKITHQMTGKINVSSSLNETSFAKYGNAFLQFTRETVLALWLSWADYPTSGGKPSSGCRLN